MKKAINVNKPIGLTPFEAITKLKEKMPEFQDKKIGYAGRLDPMAEGVLILLVGEENKNAKKYQALDKEYKFEAFFGVQTDTYDTLGILKSSRFKPSPNDIEIKINDLVKKLYGKHKQPFPPYSSARVNGKPLFYWARKGKLSQLKIPSKKVNIFALKLTGKYQIPKAKLQNTIIKRITMVKGNFRQESINKTWKKFFKYNREKSYPIFNFRLSCSSGTYVRSLVNDMGSKIGTGAIALHIKRTRVGSFLLSESQKI